MSPDTSDSNSNPDNHGDLTRQKTRESDSHANLNYRPPTPQTKTNGLLSLATRLLDDASLSHTDIPILACCAISGICDSVAFNATGTFASMQTGMPFHTLPSASTQTNMAKQTGNTIFLALGASHLPPNQPTLWLRALVSIASFWAGCLLFSQLHRLTHHPKRKLVLAISFLVQTIFIIIPATLAQSRTIVPSFSKTSLSTHLTEAELSVREMEENSATTLIPLALLAFQFGGQIVGSRVLGINEVPTNVLTSLYCDLLSDPFLLVGLGRNKKRDRRVLAIVILVAGGVVGGWLQRSSAGMSGALWIAAGIKGVVTVCWLFWRGESKGDGDAAGAEKKGGVAVVSV